jgi:hypothetical protein
MRFVLILIVSLLFGAAEMSWGQAPRILTPQQVKNYWLNTFPQPAPLDRDFHQKKRQYEELVANVRSGALDNEASLAALTNNVKSYEAAGDPVNAEASRKALAELKAKITEEERLAELRAIRSELESLRRSIDLLRTQGLSVTGT